MPMKSTAAMPTAILGSGNSEVEPVIANTSSSPILVSAKNCDALCKKEEGSIIIAKADDEVRPDRQAPGRNADTHVLAKHSNNTRSAGVIIRPHCVPPAVQTALQSKCLRGLLSNSWHTGALHHHRTGVSVCGHWIVLSSSKPRYNYGEWGYWCESWASDGRAFQIKFGMIVYALVARQRSVLAEATNSSSGNFPTVTRVLLAKIDTASDCRMSYVYDAHIFHYIVDDGITFLCMATDDQKRRTTFDFLENVKSVWREKYGSVEKSALAFSLDGDFKPVLQSKMMHYSKDNPESDQILKINQRIDSVKDVMVENIDKVLESREKIELLVDKSEILSQHAYKFEKSSRTLKNDLWCKGVRNKIIIGVVALLIILFILAMVCGLDLHSCSS